MKVYRRVYILTLVCIGASILATQAACVPEEFTVFPKSILKENDDELVKQLRAKEYSGVVKFYNDNLAILSKHPSANDTQAHKIHAQFDQICGQKNCYTSKLYWFNDLELAKTEAQRRNKPILSLHLLGNLTDEFSCANSRFFRTVLYADPEIAALMKDYFILHWQSVRTAPKVVVDYGDGTRLESTITGNSIHYILSPDGTVVDGLPGLYGARRFGRALRETVRTKSWESGLNDSQRLDRLVSQRHLSDFEQRLLDFRQSASNKGLVFRDRRIITPKSPSTESQAVEAQFMARSKAIGELALISRTSWVARQTFYGLDPATGLPKLNMESISLEKLSGQSKELFRNQIGELYFEAALKSFENTLSEDSYRNDIELRPRVREIIVRHRQLGLNSINEKIYDELFLTPLSDRWMGLYPSGHYVGLNGSGIVENLSATNNK